MIKELIAAEAERQASQITLIPSENYASKAVLEATGSILANKYAEGYPGRRYYAGNGIIDRIEEEVRRLAAQVFATDYHVNVQAHSGSPANLAVYSALLSPGDTVLAMGLSQGGHLSHGHTVSLTGKLYRFIHYGVSPGSELIDYQEVRRLAMEARPKMIVCGATAYPALLDFTVFSRIAQEVGALLLADISHIAGLVAGDAHPSPFGLADVVTTTTHKSLRGPRGALIFCREPLAKAIDKAVFPGLQGGPHMHGIAAMGVALEEAARPAFRDYASQVVANARSLAYLLQQQGFRLVADGTENHLMLLDLNGTGLGGKEAMERLETAGIVANMNLLPFDSRTPADPPGLRLGTPAVTSRGMKEKEMETIASAIAAVLRDPEQVEPTASLIGSLAKRFRIPAFY